MNLNVGEGIWAKGSHPKPIADEEYLGFAFDYIEGHEKRGAIVIVPENPEFEMLEELGEETGLRDFGCLDEDDNEQQ